jgi:hypothetical protein
VVIDSGFALDDSNGNVAYSLSKSVLSITTVDTAYF